MRLDVYLAESGMAKSRSRARELILAGHVTVSGEVVTKPAFDVGDCGEAVEITSELHPFVGRGGIKLDGALDDFGIDAAGLTAVDIGASSGGFTDCLLKRGAVKVYAVDSGSGQLDPTLLSDDRVINIEHCNARYLTEDDLGERCDIAVADLSFISVTYIIPRLPLVLKDSGIYVGLVKPQFECGVSALSKNGIVKDKKHHRAAIERVVSSLKETGFGILGIASSKIKGGDGNSEFLVYAALSPDNALSDDEIMRQTELAVSGDTRKKGD